MNINEGFSNNQSDRYANDWPLVAVNDDGIRPAESERNAFIASNKSETRTRKTAW